MFGSHTFSLKGFLSCLVVLALLFSFGLHAVQIPHEHVTPPHAHGDHEHGEEKRAQGFQMLETAFHISDKKLYLISLFPLLLASFLSETYFATLLLFAISSLKTTYSRYGKQFRIFDYMGWYFRKGIVHSKAYQ